MRTICGVATSTALRTCKSDGSVPRVFGDFLMRQRAEGCMCWLDGEVMRGITSEASLEVGEGVVYVVRLEGLTD